MKYVVAGRNVLNVFMIQDCMFVHVPVCFKAKFLIDRALELIDKYSVILFYIIFNGGGLSGHHAKKKNAVLFMASRSF